jgi:transposase-like protein
MDKIDLIIDALERANELWLTESIGQQALAAARELKALAKPEQEEPLRVADAIELNVATKVERLFAANELRRLQEENETLKKCLFQMQNAAIELAKPEQEPKLTDAGAETNISRGLEPKGEGMLMFNQPNPEHKPWCDYLNIVLTSMPPQKAKCNCKNAQPEQEPVGQFVGGIPEVNQQREWVGLTDEEIWECQKPGLSDDVYKLIEAKLREKNS